MPIAKQWRQFYLSPEWIDTRNRRLTMANHRCEQCGKPNRAIAWVVRDGTGRWSLYGTECWYDHLGRPIEAPRNRSWHRIRVVLTCAHLDHDPPSLDLERLRALCQHCHLKYDVQSHRAQRRYQQECHAQQITLFEWQPGYCYASPTPRDEATTAGSENQPTGEKWR